MTISPSAINGVWLRRAGIFCLLLIGLGMPLARPEHFWLLVVGLPAVVLGNPRASRTAWVTMFVLCLLGALIRTAIGAGDIRIAANVFSPGNEHFRTVIPPAVLEAATSDFKAHYGSYERNVPRAVSRNFAQWGLPEGITFRKRILVIDSLIDWPLGTVNSRNYNTNRYNRTLRFTSEPPTELMNRRHMPYYAIVTFTDRHAERQLCVRGNVFWKSDGAYNRLGSPQQTECMVLQFASDGELPVIVAYQTGPDDELHINLEASINDYFSEAAYRAVPWLFSAVVLVALVDLRRLSISTRLALVLTLVVAVATIVTYRKSAFDLPPFGTFVVHQEGNDGLTYSGFGRQIVNAVLDGRYAEALRGGEDLYLYQPGFRYVQAANLALFGPSSAGAVLAASLVTLALLGLGRRFLPNGRAWPFLLLWLLPLLPVLDAIATGLGLSTPVRTHATYPQVVRWGIFGFGEPTALLLALMASAICLHLMQGRDQSVRRHFLAGFLMSVAILIRVNWVPSGALVLGGVALISVQRSNWRQLIALVCSVSPLLVMPLHNYWYGGEWVLSTTQLRTGTMLPVDLELVRAAMSLDTVAIERVFDHWGLLLTDGRLILIVASIVALVMPSAALWVRAFAAAALVGFAPYLFLTYRSRYLILPDLLGALVFWRLALFEVPRLISAARMRVLNRLRQASALLSKRPVQDGFFAMFRDQRARGLLTPLYVKTVVQAAKSAAWRAR